MGLSGLIGLYRPDMLIHFNIVDLKIFFIHIFNELS